MRPTPTSPPPAVGAAGEGAAAPRGWRVRLSLEHQFALLLALSLLVVGAGGVAASVWGVRGELQAVAARDNAGNAAALASALARLHGVRADQERLLAAEWASGAQQRIDWTPPGGAPGFSRAAVAGTGRAPAWFVRLAGVAPAPGVATTADGPGEAGRIEVEAALVPLQERLWQAALDAVLAIGGLGLLVALGAAAALAHLRRLLAPALEQARVLAGGRFATAPEPAAPELQVLTRAMNGMVERLKTAVDVQVAQVEQLRRHAHVDALTGLSNRPHFLAQLDAALLREDGTAQCGLLLMRLHDLAGINRLLGHGAADRIIAALAQSLQTYAERVPGCIPGRLNGADFALCLPVGGMALETAQTLAATMRVALPSLGPGIAVSLGAAELHHGLALADAIALADEALARAELRGAFGVEVMTSASHGQRAGVGESAWRRGIDAALAEGRAALVSFPLVDAQGALLHLESPLRIQIDAGGAFEPAALWLPLAARTRMTGAADARAVELAVRAIAADGTPRGVNLAPSSLAESDFASRLRAVLFAAPRAARKLSLEIDEAAAVDRFALLRELARLVRPCGVRFGLEHAGRQLAGIDHLFEDWLDFVKLDASFGIGAGTDPQRAGFVTAAVGLLHGLAIDVYAEGVRDDADAAALWACGVDGITGPWATARHGAKG